MVFDDPFLTNRSGLLFTYRKWLRHIKNNRWVLLIFVNWVGLIDIYLIEGIFIEQLILKVKTFINVSSFLFYLIIKSIISIMLGQGKEVY